MANNIRIISKIFIILEVIILSNSAAADTPEIRKIGTIEAWMGMVSVGNNGIIRKIEDLGLRYYRTHGDTLRLRKQYPQWKGEGCKVEDFKWSGAEFVNSSPVWLTDDMASAMLPGDTMRHGFDSFLEDEYDLKISTHLPKRMFPKMAKIKHFRKMDINCDGIAENVVVFTEFDYPSQVARLPIVVLVYQSKDKKITTRFYERFEEGWGVGPVEFKDVTQDNCPEIIFYTLAVGGSGHTYMAHIYSATKLSSLKR